jgi:hypothetical protein
MVSLAGRVNCVMAEYRLPHEVYYETKDPVSIADVIESLRGTEWLLLEMGPLLQVCIPGLIVDRIQVTVRNISEGGSLKEVVWAAIFLTFQHDLETDVPMVLENLFGTKLGHEYPAITSICFLLLLYYGADLAFQRITKIVQSSQIRAELDSMIKEVSGEFNISEERLRSFVIAHLGSGTSR